MKLWKFDDYDSYLAAQVAGTERRIRRNQRSCASVKEIQTLRDRLGDKPKFILCHGSGNGGEIIRFRNSFPEATIIGTDLVEWGPETVKWDFNKPNPEWVGIADLLYSNSLDHSPDPVETLKVWFDQIKNDGIVAIQWNLNHVMMMNKDHIYVGGDCFTSHLDEFVQIIDKVGIIKEVIFVEKTKRGGMDFIILSGRRS